MTDDQMALVAKGLAHPVRLKIIEQFDGSRCHMAQEIVDACGLAQSTISEHLRILRRAEIVFVRRDGPRTWYCLRRTVLRNYADAVLRLEAPRLPFPAG